MTLDALHTPYPIRTRGPRTAARLEQKRVHSRSSPGAARMEQFLPREAGRRCRRLLRRRAPVGPRTVRVAASIFAEPLQPADLWSPELRRPRELRGQYGLRRPHRFRRSQGLPRASLPRIHTIAPRSNSSTSRADIVTKIALTLKRGLEMQRTQWAVVTPSTRRPRGMQPTAAATSRAPVVRWAAAFCGLRRRRGLQRAQMLSAALWAQAARRGAAAPLGFSCRMV